MTRYRLDVAYDGTDFAGWQRQANAPSVQQTIERVLTRVDGDRPVVLHAAGRTDAGVHARQQVAHFDLQETIGSDDLCHALACMLPESVRPVEVRRVADDFSARYRKQRKSYLYQLDRTPRGDPLLARYAWHVARPLDEALLGRCLLQLPGRRDWSGFVAASCTIEDRVRTLDLAEFVPGHPDQLRFRADGFLTHMARNLVGTLVAVATGRLEPRAIARALTSGDRGEAGPTAPARGLILERIEYDDEG